MILSRDDPQAPRALVIYVPLTTQYRGSRYEVELGKLSFLKEPSIANLVVETIVAGERERGFYELSAWVVMPNHVHLLILPKVALPEITRWLKGSTARRANQLLGRTGLPFWQDESYDHWVRTTKELDRIIGYIEENPVSAGLVVSMELWPWSSAAWQAKPPAPPDSHLPSTGRKM